MNLRPLRLLVRFFLTSFFGFFFACAVIVIYGLNDTLHAADLAVVLGSKVNLDGRPSLMLRARLDHAIELYRKGYFKLVLVSGGTGREGYDEAAAMRDYLVANGIPGNAVIEDNDGYTTWMTAKNTARIMKERHLTSVLIVSQYFHMARCKLAFQKFDVSPIYTSHASFWSVRDFYSVPREAVGYLAYYMRNPDATDTPTLQD